MRRGGFTANAVEMAAVIHAEAVVEEVASARSQEPLSGLPWRHLARHARLSASSFRRRLRVYRPFSQTPRRMEMVWCTAVGNVRRSIKSQGLGDSEAAEKVPRE